MSALLALLLAGAAAAAEGDVLPQPARFPYAPKSPARLFFAPHRGQHHHGGRSDMKVPPGPLDRGGYPRLEKGVYLPPARYRVERYSEADRERFSRALLVARRYADVNAAHADGFRLEDKFDLGMGIHMHHLGRLMDDAVRLEEPEFLTYALDKSTGRFQLIQLGYIRRLKDGPREPSRLFDTKEAKGHFHDQDICVRVEDGAIVDAPEGRRCGLPGDVHLGPIWMMHFAVNLYNAEGMFADYFSHADWLSAERKSFSFLGEPVPPGPADGSPMSVQRWRDPEAE